jgi:hypothetical protein
MTKIQELEKSELGRCRTVGEIHGSFFFFFAQKQEPQAVQSCGSRKEDITDAKL